jgi:hypothetical protein
MFATVMQLQAQKTHTIGEKFGCGIIIFDFTPDGHHGLIAKTQDQGMFTWNKLKLGAKQHENIFKKMEKAKDKWMEFIDFSFLSTDFKERYKQLIQERFIKIEPK